MFSLLGVAIGFSASQALLFPVDAEADLPVAVPEPILLPPRDFSIDFFGLTFDGNTAELIDRTVLRRGAFEKHVLFFLADLLENLGRRDSLYVDVGANIGQHVLFLAPRVAQVHAIEPYPPVLKRLQQHLERNHLDNVQVHAVGLGAQHGTLRFHVPPPGNHGVGSFAEVTGAPAAEVVELPMVPGDEILPAVDGSAPVLVKIDVEGYERPVLEGMRHFLESGRPVLILELTPNRAESFASEDALRALLPPDYRVLRLLDPIGRESGHYQLDAHLPFDSTSHFEVVAYPAALDPQIPRDNMARDPYQLMQDYRVQPTRQWVQR